MRFFLGPIFVFSALCAFAQTEDPPEVARAKAGIDRLRSLVEAGVAPRIQLDKAEAAIADAEDSALLRRTLYGTELNDAQADDTWNSPDLLYEIGRAFGILGNEDKVERYLLRCADLAPRRAAVGVGEKHFAARLPRGRPRQLGQHRDRFAARGEGGAADRRPGRRVDPLRRADVDPSGQLVAAHRVLPESVPGSLEQQRSARGPGKLDRARRRGGRVQVPHAIRVDQA